MAKPMEQNWDILPVQAFLNPHRRFYMKLLSKCLPVYTRRRTWYWALFPSAACTFCPDSVAALVHFLGCPQNGAWSLPEIKESLILTLLKNKKWNISRRAASFWLWEAVGDNLPNTLWMALDGVPTFFLDIGKRSLKLSNKIDKSASIAVLLSDHRLLYQKWCYRCKNMRTAPLTRQRYTEYTNNLLRSAMPEDVTRWLQESQAQRAPTPHLTHLYNMPVCLSLSSSLNNSGR